MKFFEKKAEIKVEKDDLVDAKLSTIDYTDELIKKRAFIDVLGARLAIKMLFSQKIEANNAYSLYTVHSVLEDLDIADVYFDGIKIDVRLVFNKDEIFVPKAHFEYDLLPDLYLVLGLDDDFSCAEPLGFFEPEMIDKKNQNKDCYFFEYDNLKAPNELKAFLKKFKVPNKLEITDGNFEKAQELFLSLADKEISEDDKKFLYKQLANSFVLRERIVEFENFEIISKEIVKNESILNDSVLDIIGAQQVFEDEGENASRAEIKAEVIGEVLTDMLDEELSMPKDDAKTAEQLESESDFLSELEAEINDEEKSDSKSDSKILENGVKAIASGLEIGTVLAAGSASAAAAGAAIEGSIAKAGIDAISAGIELGANVIEKSMDMSTGSPDLNLESNDLEDFDDFMANLEATAPSEVSTAQASTDEQVITDLDDILADVEETLSFDAVESVSADIDESLSSELQAFEEPEIEEITDFTVASTDFSDGLPALDLETLNIDDSQSIEEKFFGSADVELDSFEEKFSDTDSLAFNAISDDEIAPPPPLAPIEEEISFEAIKNQADAFADFDLDASAFNVVDDNSFGVVEENKSIDDYAAKSGSSFNVIDYEPSEVQEESVIEKEEGDEEGFELTELSTPEDPNAEIEKEEALMAKLRAMSEKDEGAPVNSNTSKVKEEQDEFSSQIDDLLSGIDLSDDEQDLLQDALKMFDEEDSKQAEVPTASVENQLPVIENQEEVGKDFNSMLAEYESDMETVEEKDPLKVLYKGEKADDDLSDLEEVKTLPAKITNKKMIIAASVAVVVVASIAINGLMHKNTAPNVAQNTPAAPIAAEGQSPEELEQNGAIGPDMNQQSQGLDSLEPQSIPGEGQQANNRDMGQAVSDAFLSEPVSASITKVAWEVPEDLAYNDGFRKYLQIAGKNLKLNLQNDLLLATDMAYSSKVVVNLSIGKNGSLQSSNIVTSSGSKQIDKIVLQSVKDTLKYLKMPSSELGGSSADATLIINF